MSITIKQAIEALKSRIADAYTAISAKGGTLPATQDSASLPAAIASIPSGGGGGLFDEFGNIGWDAVEVSQVNAKRDADLAYSRAHMSDTSWAHNTDVVYLPKTSALSSPIKINGKFDGCTNLEYIPHLTSMSSSQGGYYQILQNAFRNCHSLREIYIDGINMVWYNNRQTEYAFYNCYSLKKLTMLGKISVPLNNFIFYYTWNLRTWILGDCSGCQSISIAIDAQYAPISLENFEVSALPNISLTSFMQRCTKLTHTSLLNILNALPTTTSGYTCSIGATNLAKLDASEIAIATDKGWTLN